MKTNNYSFNVFEKVAPINRKNWNLNIDAIYKADPSKKNVSSEVLSKLLGVKNQGGFRYKGTVDSPKFVVLFTSGEDIYWKDEVDSSIGVLIYYGDNKEPGRDLHKTKIHGNEILRNIFLEASKHDYGCLKKIPPIFVFKKSFGRDVKFLGLAVPGLKGRPSKDWLTAVWGCNHNGDRFQNYKAYFTILNTDSGSSYQNGYGINLAWLNDIENGEAFQSVYAPLEWKKYISNNNYNALIARQEKVIKSKENQLPKKGVKLDMLKYIHKYFIEKDRGYSFEVFAADLTQFMNSSIVQIDVTRPFKDGGFDAEGKYKIFSNVENVIYVDFYLQAKCYNPMSNSIGVKDTARLISRIKNKQFGILFTTSYIANQAYREVLDDSQPVVFINGKDIVNYIFNELEIRDLSYLERWLSNNY